MVAEDMSGNPFEGVVGEARVYNRPLTTEDIVERIQKGIEPSLVASDFARKTEFAKLAFWLRSYGHDDDMAHFIEQIALEKNFARDYRVQTYLIKMMIKLFKAAEKYLKPPTWIPASAYFDDRKALKKEVTSIRTIINRLLQTTYRGTTRKPHGGTRDESRESPDCCKDQAQA